MLANTISIFHAILALLSVSYAFWVAMDIKWYGIDILIGCILVSFFLFKRCLVTDAHVYCKNLSNTNQHVIRDDALESFFNKLTTGKDITHRRGDISDYPPQEERDDAFMHSLRIKRDRYVAINIINAVLLMYRFGYIRYSPIIVVWILSCFHR